VVGSVVTEQEPQRVKKFPVILLFLGSFAQGFIFPECCCRWQSVCLVNVVPARGGARVAGVATLKCSCEGKTPPNTAAPTTRTNKHAVKIPIFFQEAVIFTFFKHFYSRGLFLKKLYGEK
jgi:hypothetical protein